MNHSSKTALLPARRRRLFREASGMAFESLAAAQKALRAPLAKIERILKSNPSDIEALLMKGNIIEMYFLHLSEAHEEARSCYEKALTYNRTNVCALTDMGDWHGAEGEYRKAIHFYDKAIALLKRGKFHRSQEEEMEEAYMGKINALKELKEHKAAQRCAKEGLQYCPNSKIFHS